MNVFVSLFRAVNVGSNKVAMPQLEEMHRRTGFENPHHLLQTGSIVFESKEKDSDKVAAQLKKEFEKEFGFATEVMVRTAAEMKKIVSKNPWSDDKTKDSKWLLVVFLTGEPDKEAQEALTIAYSGPEEMVFSGKEIYIYYTNGVGKSRLTNAYLEKKLKVLGTGRNWNTVSKLLEMMG